MSELRRDPITRAWVLFPSEGPSRPPEISVESRFPQRASACPFCPGHEHATPPEILAFRQHGSPANSPGWRLRVVPNLFPALRVEARLEREGAGPYDRISGFGAHEIVIESPSHDQDLGDMAPSQLSEVLWCWRERLSDLRRDARLKAALVFRSRGAQAGALLAHPHSQIIALPVLPAALDEELRGSARYYSERERCAYCDILKEELRQKSRLICENAAAVSFAPYASRRPFEAWVLPRRHEPAFEAGDGSALFGVAEILGATLQRLARALDRPGYYLALHSAPYGQSESPSYHWHIEILPALSPPPGLEVSSGCAINPTAPETAAAFLREVSL